MNKRTKEILEKLRSLNTSKIEVFSGMVKSVDEEAGTMEIMPDDDDAEFVLPCLLRADDDGLKGIVPLPEVGSEVVVSSVDGGAPFILVRASKLSGVLIDVPELTIKCDAIEINGGINNGLIIIEALKNELELYNKLLQAFLNELKTPINEPGNGSPSAFQAKLLAALSAYQLPTFANIENTKVKHG